jgi:hypothetical protein
MTQDITVTIDGGLRSALEIEDGGSVVLSESSGLNFDTGLSASDDGDGSVTVSAPGSTDTHVDVEDDGSVAVSDVSAINFGTNVSVSDDGDGSVTVDASGGTDLSDSGGVVVSQAGDITFSASGDASVTVSDDGDGTGTVDVGATDTDTRHPVAVTTQTAAYTASDGDAVLADASGGAFSVTLPSPSAGGRVDIKKIDSSSNGVTVATPNAETIDGQSSITLSAQYANRTIISDGSKYYVL